LCSSEEGGDGAGGEESREGRMISCSSRKLDEDEEDEDEDEDDDEDDEGTDNEEGKDEIGGSKEGLLA